MNRMMRLAKFLALAGVASRRRAEEIIRDGQVWVNGAPQKDLTKQIDETRDKVTYRNRRLQIEDKVYYLVHKPEGYISAASGRKGEKLVVDLVPPRPKVYPVGRLDKDSSGLILLTNDGDLAYRLMHPKFEIAKTYIVRLKKVISPASVERLLQGIPLEEGLAKADRVKLLQPKMIEITIHQGWNRQIRRMIGALGNEVLHLKRIQEGNLKLLTLKPGMFKPLKAENFHD